MVTAVKSFHFIVSNGAKVPQDASTRTLIRKQAMKDIGIARSEQAVRTVKPKLGNTTPIAIIPPIEVAIAEDTTFIDPQICELNDEELFADTNGPASTSNDQSWQLSVVSSRSPSSLTSDEGEHLYSLFSTVNPSTEYQKLRLRYSFDLMDLSFLTSFNVSQVALWTMQSQPELLQTLLGHRICSYLHHVPSRYGQGVKYFDAVLHCILAKASSRMRPSEAGPTLTATRLYVKALREVQTAISDKSKCNDADLLCAVQMLSCYEIMDSKSLSAFSNHVSGSAQLVRSRSATRFRSEYERLLFLSHVGAAYSETFFQNRASHLAEPEWMQLYDSLTEESTWLTDTHPLMIRVRKVMIYFPGILAKLDTAFDDTDDCSAADKQVAIELRLRSMQQDTLHALEAYKAHVLRTSMLRPPDCEVHKRREVFGSIMEGLCVIKRTIATICDFERPQLEHEIQSIAQLVLGLREQQEADHSWVFTIVEYGVAQLVVDTKEQWLADTSTMTAAEKTAASKSRWLAFKRAVNLDANGADYVAYNPPGRCASFAYPILTTFSETLKTHLNPM
ncbi:hypothetical protein B0A48_18757 [Cryoendolithus antarcticus]|uniref:Uncharacterized protein n=1 Tax=Cryoendolithus antarcticus TaxID=1507870 RepID=A0A1V8S7Y8_9PEZI|nr:hypothetical protein B0A48_18757 [Cryoendolithus antarcticus]